MASKKNLVINGDFSQGIIGWTKSSGTWDFSTGKAVLTATTAWLNIYQFVNVSPNTRYKVSLTKTGLASEMWVGAFNGATDLNNNLVGVNGLGYNQASGTYTAEFTTPTNCNRIKLSCDNNTVTTGTFSFDDINLIEV